MFRLRLLLALTFPAVLSVFSMGMLPGAGEMPGLAVPTAGMAGSLSLAVVLTAGLTAVALVCVIGVRLEPAAAPARIRAIALRVRAWHAGFLRLRDPGAPGRARPRAPSRPVTVA